MKQMAVRLSTTVSKIASLPDATNAALISEFYQYMKKIGASESHTNNSLKPIWHLLNFLAQMLPFMISKEKKILLEVNLLKYSIDHPTINSNIKNQFDQMCYLLIRIF